MHDAVRTGVSFGLTSAVITTLGLMVGLASGTKSELAVLGGILTIAVADGLSDALGIHVSEEADGEKQKHVWISTFTTLGTKMVSALSFMVPVILLPLAQALWVSVAWGLFLIGIFSYHVGENEPTESWKVILEHVTIAIVVVIATHYTGVLISSFLS
ncbi:MAG: hypothetical protein ACLFS3_02250 [Candidatus Aenigmatarchaeota archaeon]